MADIKDNKYSSGQIQISDEVIATIARASIMEVEGIVSTVSNFADDIIEKIGKKSSHKGINIKIKANEVEVGIDILVYFGHKIQEVALEAQKRVKTDIETMTGLSVVAVNVNVVGLEYENNISDNHEN